MIEMRERILKVKADSLQTGDLLYPRREELINKYIEAPWYSDLPPKVMVTWQSQYPSLWSLTGGGNDGSRPESQFERLDMRYGKGEEVIVYRLEEVEDASA